jgi:hypothetical protein
MTSTRRFPRPAAPWLRVLAVVCAGMVLLVAAAATSPALHAWLHGETSASEADHVCANAHAHSSAPDEADTDHAHACAITLFSHGVTSASILIATLDRLSAAPDAAPSSCERVTLPEPSHLRPQPQAPPVA